MEYTQVSLEQSESRLRRKKNFPEEDQESLGRPVPQPTLEENLIHDFLYQARQFNTAIYLSFYPKGGFLSVAAQPSHSIGQLHASNPLIWALSKGSESQAQLDR